VILILRSIRGSWLIILGAWECIDTRDTQQREWNGKQEREPTRHATREAETDEYSELDRK
jgi:hypothetical protein